MAAPHEKSVLARLRRDERGITLSELLVAMALLGVLSAMVASMFAGTVRATQISDRRVQSTAQAQTGMDTLARAIRTATRVERDGAPALAAFAANRPLDLTVHSLTGARPERVRYYLDTRSGTLMEETRPADPASRAPYYTFSTPATRRAVTTDVVNSSTVPLFTFYDEAGARVSPSTNQALLNSVRSVDVTILVQSDPTGRATPTELRHRFYLPNIGAPS